MVVICTVELFLPAAESLKGKRHIVKGLLGRIAARTGASVAETGYQDLWQRTILEMALAGSSKGVLERELAIIRNLVDDCAEAETVFFNINWM